MSGFEPIPEQPDQVAGRAIAWLLVATVLAIGACVLVVLALRGGVAGGGRSSLQHLALTPPAAPFSTDLERTRAAQRAGLDRWSWADRGRRRVRVPVDVAIERYLAQRGAR